MATNPAPELERDAARRDDALELALFVNFLVHGLALFSALSTQPLRRRTVTQAIELGIPLEACVPLDGDVSSRAAEAIVGAASPLCFYVADLQFAFNGETYDEWK